MTFYGAVQQVDINGSVVVLRCLREYYHADGLMADDVWLWTICGVTDVAAAQALLGRSICRFEIAQGSLKVGLEEGDEDVIVEGLAVTKVEEPRNSADLERVIVDLSRRIQQDERAFLAITKKIGEIATSIYQKIDRLERRSEFEARRRGETPKEISREIEDLLGIVRRLEEPNKSPEPTPTTVTPRASERKSK